jgi:hypothetical protein
LETTNLTLIDIQRKLGLSSRSTIYRLRDMIERRIANEAGDFCPRRLNGAKRCPKHGLVNVWPCVACEAENHRRT